MRLLLKSPLKDFKVNQLFGVNGAYYQENGINIKGHNGLDLQAKDGTDVFASHDGIVTFSGHDGAGGLTVVLRTLEKFNYELKDVYFKTIYVHLKEGSVVVKVDQKVKVGDKIAQADNTGFSTGSHLHWGLKPVYKGEKSWEYLNLEPDNGYLGAIDPFLYLEGAPYLFEKDLGLSQIYDREVEEFQKFLESVECMVLPADGKGLYGPKTRAGVFKFQEKYVGLSWYEKYVLKGSKVGPKTRGIANTIIINRKYK